MSRISRGIAAIGLTGASLMASATTITDDFSSGGLVVGTTAYTPIVGNTVQGGYEVVANPGTTFPASNGFTSYFDHTLGNADGRMMYFDGAADPSTTLWSATVPLLAGVTYTFSFWASAASGSAQPVLAFSIDHQQEGQPLSTAGFPGVWSSYSTSFVRGVAGDALLSITDLVTDRIGNDGAIDDISLTFDAPSVDPGNPGNPVPEPEEAALMAGGLGILGWMTRRRVRHPSILQTSDAVAVA